MSLDNLLCKIIIRLNNHWYSANVKYCKSICTHSLKFLYYEGCYEGLFVSECCYKNYTSVLLNNFEVQKSRIGQQGCGLPEDSRGEFISSLFLSAKAAVPNILGNRDQFCGRQVFPRTTSVGVCGEGVGVMVQVVIRAMGNDQEQQTKRPSLTCHSPSAVQPGLQQPEDQSWSTARVGNPCSRVCLHSLPLWLLCVVISPSLTCLPSS